MSPSIALLVRMKIDRSLASLVLLSVPRCVLLLLAGHAHLSTGVLNILVNRV